MKELLQKPSPSKEALDALRGYVAEDLESVQKHIEESAEELKGLVDLQSWEDVSVNWNKNALT